MPGSAPPNGDAAEIARLRARVAGLEAALERRSRELRALQRLACPPDLMILGRISAGLSPLAAGPYDIEQWPETFELRSADVEETLVDLWDSVVPLARPGDA